MCLVRIDGTVSEVEVIFGEILCCYDIEVNGRELSLRFCHDASPW